MARSASAPMEVFLSRDRLENLVMVDWMLIMVMILMFMVHMVMFFLLGIWLLFKIFFKGDSEQLQAVFLVIGRSVSRELRLRSFKVAVEYCGVFALKFL
jgi:hypothetical protein